MPCVRNACPPHKDPCTKTAAWAGNRSRISSLYTLPEVCPSYHSSHRVAKGSLRLVQPAHGVQRHAQVILRLCREDNRAGAGIGHQCIRSTARIRGLRIHRIRPRIVEHMHMSPRVLVGTHGLCPPPLRFRAAASSGCCAAALCSSGNASACLPACSSCAASRLSTCQRRRERRCWAPWAGGASWPSTLRAEPQLAARRPRRPTARPPPRRSQSTRRALVGGAQGRCRRRRRRREATR